METIFTVIFAFFKDRKALLCAIFAAIFILLGWSASTLRMEQDLMKVLPNTDGDVQTAVFERLKVKDKLTVMIRSNGHSDVERICTEADTIASMIRSSLYPDYIKSIRTTVSLDELDSVRGGVLRHIPILYSQSQAITPATIDSAIAQDVMMLTSPTGAFIKDNVFADPLMLSSDIYPRIRAMQISDSYTTILDHIFIAADTTCIITLETTKAAGDIDADERIVCALESIIAHEQSLEANKDLHIDYFGGPAIAAYNSRQIQSDLHTTLFISLGLILLVILLTFRDKRAVLLIMLPCGFGLAFSLGVIACMQESISLIAFGASSAIVGVVLSYSIHIVCHSEHSRTREEIVSEMASPLTVGSLTTIGAFASLTFTNSELLRDFGLLSSLSIVGATLFCLICLPHFLQPGAGSHSYIYMYIERLNSIRLEHNYILIAVIAIASAYGLWHITDSEFSADMDALCYQPEKFAEPEARLKATSQSEGQSSIYFIATGSDAESALRSYEQMNGKLDSLHSLGLITRHSHCQALLPSRQEQQRRIARWVSVWHGADGDRLRQQIQTSAAKYGFAEEAFASFVSLTQDSITPISADSIFIPNKQDWIYSEGGITMVMANVCLNSADKDRIYSQFASDDVVILDKPHFVSRYVESINEDFNFVLMVSSLIVFIALLVNYGRLETALLSFLPMAVSWLIIIGFMHLFGLQFNIVSAIISTFIFGIGDDFSIFITDGLISEYRSHRQTLTSHKTAIFFSAFVTIAGMGSLLFAEHPSMQSVAQSSLIGMLAVLLSAYTLQPLIFHIFVSSRIARKLPPISISDLAWSAVLIVPFAVAGIVLSIVAAVAYILPIPKRWKLISIHYFIYAVCRSILLIARPLIRQQRENPSGEQFDRPAMIIANHQSVLDILQVLALTPKVVIMAKKSNWNSPIYGILLHLSGFFCSDDSIDSYIADLEELTQQYGFSICVFPEGRRSADGELQRFQAGAFALASRLELDIVPIVFAGNHMAINRSDLILINPSEIRMLIMPRDTADNSDYRARARQYEAIYADIYTTERHKVETPSNPFYYARLMQNFAFKGPVTEHYARIKVRLEHSYADMHSLLPLSGTIVDLGCGYGHLTLMLHLLSPSRHIIGIDHDDEKIAVAQHCFSRGSNLEYQAADIATSTPPPADAYVLSDVLHYISRSDRQQLLSRCLERLTSGGIIVVRDADQRQVKRHRMTRFSEWLSTSSILDFNKVNGQISYLEADEIEQFAASNGLKLEKRNNDQITSNVVYVLRRSI